MATVKEVYVLHVWAWSNWAPATMISVQPGDNLEDKVFSKVRAVKAGAPDAKYKLVRYFKGGVVEVGMEPKRGES